MTVPTYTVLGGTRMLARITGLGAVASGSSIVAHVAAAPDHISGTFTLIAGVMGLALSGVSTAVAVFSALQRRHYEAKYGSAFDPAVLAKAFEALAEKEHEDDAKRKK